MHNSGGKCTAGIAITKQAVGRHGTIGSLYDIRSERFEGGNLFNQKLPPSLVVTTDCASSDYFVDDNRSQNDTFNKLNVEASMKLSLMAGIITVEGSAKYLNQTKTNSRTVRVTYMFNVKTKQEDLQISMAELHKYFSPDALENQHATHCVIGITYGAHVAATFEQTLATVKQAEELQGRLSAQLKKATLDVGGDANLQYDDKNDSESNSMKITFSGDVLIDKVPNSVEDVFGIFEKVPSMLQSLNEGKGKPIQFELYPLKRMAEIFKHELHIERVINEVMNLTINRIESIFEQIIQGKRMINDFLAKIESWEAWLPSEWITVIHDKKTELVGQELQIQRQLATLLEQIRRGEADEKEMLQLLDSFDHENPCSKKSIKEFLKANAKIDAKIKSLGEFDREAVADEEKKPNPKILLKEFTSVRDFILRGYNDDVYLLHISNGWEEKDKVNWYRQLRCFCLFLDTNEPKKPICRVIDHDLHTDLDMKPDTCVIYHAQRGAIKSYDYYHTSRETLSPQEIRKIKTNNKFMTLNDKGIEEWHTKFMTAYPSGELNKDDFIAEFKELYRYGNPEPYCNYVFNTIDKDRSGSINFVEFISAFSLSVLGNIEKQLTLVFEICADHGSEKVSSEELVKFLELVAELEGGEDAIDPHGATLVVKEIMKCRSEENDNEKIDRTETDKEKITKKAFLACLKENDELAIEFLPIICKKLSDEQIGLIMSRYPDATRKDILKEHRQILVDFLTGKVTKATLIGDVKKIFPGGNPVSFCNYIFKAIDRDGKGIIDFATFVNVKHIVNKEDKLDLVLKAIFILCNMDASGTIDCNKMAKLLKAIAELNEGQDETDTYDASSYTLNDPKSIAGEIMKRCGKSNNDKITEKEFIDCCKSDYKLYSAFLPYTTRLSKEEFGVSKDSLTGNLGPHHDQL